MRKVSIRLLPFLLLLYIFCWLDRGNVSMAALQMNQELKFSSAVFGLGAGAFYISYALFEVPSNLILARVGARRWLARIAITWGILACAMMWVRNATEFYVVRFLLGAAEAGFTPGLIYYMGLWFPEAYRARAIAGFMVGIQLSVAIGAVLGGMLLGLTGLARLSGWQWLFLIEGLPSVLLGVAALWVLTDKPMMATWLSEPQRQWLAHRLEQEQERVAATDSGPLRALLHPLVWMLIFPYFTLSAIGSAAGNWGPTLVHDALGLTLRSTGLIVSGIYLLAALAFPLAGALSDRSEDRCGWAAVGLALYAVGGVGFALSSSPIGRVACFAVMVLGNPFFNASFWCLPTKFLRGTSAAAGIAMVSSVGATGSIFSPALVGLLKDSGVEGAAYAGLGVLAFLGALVLLALRRKSVFRSQVGETVASTTTSL
jgi:ACS family tartrate transporter-like MFS transporter